VTLVETDRASVPNIQIGLSEEDELRAAFYRMLAVALSAPPSSGMLAACAGLQSGDSAFGKAVTTLAVAARMSDPAALATEYHNLFVGLGRGELVPYGSYYLTGFLQEKPLAKLRQDMARLGVQQATDNPDPEDHIAAVLDTMAGLIDGRFGEPLCLHDQKLFFTQHIAAWAPIFFQDLERVAHSSFYAAVGSLGRAFLSLETAAFAMDT
jgi:TorA maturation chaperone TorD